MDPILRDASVSHVIEGLTTAIFYYWWHKIKKVETCRDVHTNFYENSSIGSEFNKGNKQDTKAYLSL